MRGLRIVVIVEKNIRHDFDAPVAVIENHEQPHDHENHFGKLQVVFRRRRHRFFEMTDNIVTEKTDGAAGEARQVWLRHETEPGHNSFEGRERIRAAGVRHGLAVFIGANCAILAADCQTRPEAEKRVAARLLGLLGRFEEKRITAVIQFLECRGRGLGVRHEIDENGNDIAAFRELCEALG